MIKDLVTYQTAVLAKEKGFDKPCYYYFNDTLSKRFGEDGYWLKSSLKGRDIILRPEQYLLQQWLREEHRIRVFVENKVAGDFGFVIYITNPEKEKMAGTPWIRISHFTLHFSTYELALEQGLTEGLKLIEIESEDE